jgi:Ni,Fe-hydrogenase III component G
MSAIIDANAMHAVFEVPSPEGVYPPKFAAYFRALGRKRPLLFLAFAPKAAGTFLRQAAMEALGGGCLIRFTHAQGGRDGTPYLPTFMAAYLDAEKPASIGHLHMQALPANRHFIDMFGIKPVIMLRDIPDMLASYWDMLEIDPVARADGLNCQIPDDFVSLSREQKADFMIDVVAPWYASYFATWKTFHDEAPQTVCVLHYDEFQNDPSATLFRALQHAGFQTPRAKCEAAIERVWNDRTNFRFNRGVGGRGREYFSPGHLKALERMLALYKQLEPWKRVLIGGAVTPTIRLAS